jgi:dipeptidyl aminopeptidase/acylaminoacyl peptidase
MPTSCLFTLAGFAVAAQGQGALPMNGPIEVPMGDDAVPVWLALPDSYTGAHAHPLVLFFHGRGYGKSAADTNMLKDEFAEFRRIAGERGYILAAVAVGPNTWMNEVARARTDAALAFLAERLSIDPGAIYTAGVSMGGGAALTYAKHNPYRIGAVVDFMGVTDFTRFYREGFYNESLAGAFGGTPDEVPEVHEAQSAISDPEAFRDIPVLLIHGDQDTVIPPWNAVEFSEKLKPLGNGSELILRPGMGHTNEIVQGLESRILDFLDAHRRSAGAGPGK